MNKLAFFKILFLNLVLSISPNVGAIDRQIIENLPKKETITSAYIGDKIITSRVGVQKNCITPKFNYERSYLSVVQGKPICKESDSKKNRYMPTYANDNTRSDGAPGKRRIIFENNNGEIKFKFHRSRVSVKNLKITDFEIGQTFIPSENSINKYVEYVDKKENLLYFVYKEKRGTSNEGFTREFEIDLNDSKIASYKGVVFEIISASNSKIEYKVLRYFIH